jgi:hypothetical protein
LNHRWRITVNPDITQNWCKTELGTTRPGNNHKEDVVAQTLERRPMKTEAALSVVLGFTLLRGCDRVIRSGPIIDDYKVAQCIPVHHGLGPADADRTWNDSLATPSGGLVQVTGAQLPGGRINVRYLSDGADVVAAEAGDYIYSADVRFDQGSVRLFIKAYGVPAAFGGPEAWLFEFDLPSRKQIGRARVDPAVLPNECPIQ